ncbi:hypothetical protein CU098_010117 [Rhizopus stolonifer]|uniref:Histone chaperone RTT106/FACT complex subunit SPT16-like middle domain-containing protein n=1 Tax=Rhizopus stolonifer TaxID=4846 RepID=A0A367JYW8_RHIST|nr:hypothetical protein CU098_010117 [Rhizopus stolonifer]
MTWLEQSINDPNLRQSVQGLIESYPPSSRIIERLVQYFDNRPSDREAKKRKLESTSLTSDPLLRVVDISFQLPARKKYDLLITSTHLILYNRKTDTVEFQYDLNDLSPVGGACVPTPDKATRCYTFVLFLKKEDCIVFGTQEKGDIVVRQPESTMTLSAADKHQTLAKLITDHTRVPITQPSEDYFHSAGVSSSTGKQEDRPHVVAYLKAKDGFLFFLPTGILFGFKKPTLFFPKENLASNVTTNITQRTFDLTLTLKPGSQILGSSGFKKEEDTVQFSMIEQSEYGRIDAYTKRLGLDDQSMNEERKAPTPKVKKDDEYQDDKGKGKQTENNEDSDENDDDFEPSDADSDPLEYDTDAEQEEPAAEEHEPEEDLLQDESD